MLISFSFEALEPLKHGFTTIESLTVDIVLPHYHIVWTFIFLNSSCIIWILCMALAVSFVQPLYEMWALLLLRSEFLSSVLSHLLGYMWLQLHSDMLANLYTKGGHIFFSSVYFLSVIC